ncbi:MAG: hypothetical protein HYR74_09090 [Candidatus Eisenbacteria bacterium]|nr:hypothetical protein [Candidatus Eisenbacteria bacterium]
MHAPAFSIFSAVSELFVTAAVLYLVRRNWTGRGFSLPLFIAVALFEACVNVAYMANRASSAAAGREPIAAGMKIFYALHGMLSLLAFLWFVVLAVFAWQEQRAGRSFFRARPVLTWAFVIVWLVSVLSGETLFALRYLL